MSSFLKLLDSLATSLKNLPLTNSDRDKSTENRTQGIWNSSSASSSSSCSVSSCLSFSSSSLSPSQIAKEVKSSSCFSLTEKTKEKDETSQEKHVLLPTTHSVLSSFEAATCGVRYTLVQRGKYGCFYNYTDYSSGDSVYSRLAIWDLEKEKCLHKVFMKSTEVVRGFYYPYVAVKAKGQIRIKKVDASEDEPVKVFEVANADSVQINGDLLTGHFSKGFVNTFFYAKPFLEAKELEAVLIPSREFVVHNDLLYVVSEMENCILIIDFLKNVLIGKLSAPNCKIDDCASLFAKGNLIFASINNEIHIWDTDTKKLLKSISRKGYFPSKLQAFEDPLLITSDNNKIMMWDIHEGKELETLEIEVDSYFPAVLYDKKLFTVKKKEQKAEIVSLDLSKSSIFQKKV